MLPAESSVDDSQWPGNHFKERNQSTTDKHGIQKYSKVQDVQNKVYKLQFTAEYLGDMLERKVHIVQRELIQRETQSYTLGGEDKWTNPQVTY